MFTTLAAGGPGASEHHGCALGLQEVDRANHSWGNYVMCAYKGVYEHLARQGRPAPPLGGLQLLVDGRVPQGAPARPGLGQGLGF